MVVRRALGISSLAEAEDRSLLRDSNAATGCSWSEMMMMTFNHPVHTRKFLLHTYCRKARYIFYALTVSLWKFYTF